MYEERAKVRLEEESVTETEHNGRCDAHWFCSRYDLDLRKGKEQPTSKDLGRRDPESLLEGTIERASPRGRHDSA